jgi:hypothetical protein
MDERDDQLRERLARLDPMSGARATDPPANAHDLMETIMQTDESLPTADRARRAPRPLLWVAAAAAVVVLAVGAYAIAAGGDDEPELAQTDTTEPAALALTVTPGDPMAMCLAVDASVLAPSDLAFAGTVGEVTDTSVTIDVDQWYKGGEADVVTLSIAEGNDVALDGVAFESGERYLVSATGTTVNTCGLSGPATPEFEALYTEAFG